MPYIQTVTKKNVNLKNTIMPYKMNNIRITPKYLKWNHYEV